MEIIKCAIRGIYWATMQEIMAQFELCVQFKLQLSPSGSWEVTESKVLDQEVVKIGLVSTTWPNVETHKGMLGHRHKEEKKHEA